MLSQEDFVVIQALVRRGVYQKDIAAEMGVSPKTVSRPAHPSAASHRRRGGRHRVMTTRCSSDTSRVGQGTS